jgi:hypothetical protein
MGQQKPIRDSGRTPVPQLVSNRFEMVRTPKGSINPVSRRLLRRRWRLDSDAKATLRGYVDHAFKTAVAYSVRGSVPSRRVNESSLADLGRRYGQNPNSLRWECAGLPSSVTVEEPRSPMAGSLTPSESKNRACPARRTQKKDDKAVKHTPRENEVRQLAGLEAKPPRRVSRLRWPPASHVVDRASSSTKPVIVSEASRVHRPSDATGPPRAGPHRKPVRQDESKADASHLGRQIDQSRGHGDSLHRRVANANRRAARSPRDALHMDRFWPPAGRRVVGTFVLETGPPNNRGPTHYDLGPFSPSQRRVA